MAAGGGLAVAELAHPAIAAVPGQLVEVDAHEPPPLLVGGKLVQPALNTFGDERDLPRAHGGDVTPGGGSPQKVRKRPVSGSRSHAAGAWGRRENVLLIATFRHAAPVAASCRE